MPQKIQKCYNFFSRTYSKCFLKKMQSNVYYQRENAEKPRKICFTNHRITPEIVRWSPLFIGYSDVLQYFPQHMKNWKNSVENTLWCQTSLRRYERRKPMVWFSCVLDVVRFNYVCLIVNYSVHANRKEW